MKQNSKTTFIILFILNIFSYSKAQNTWPVGNGTDPSNITGTIGEFRGNLNNPRFHRGVDITHQSTAVYAINDGIVTIGYTGNCWTSYIRVGDISYYHIRNLAGSLSNNQTVTTGTFLGNMFDINPQGSNCNLHVHLQQEGVNFLDNGLTNFVDNTDPIFNDILFHRNPHRLDNNTSQYNILTIGTEEFSVLYGRVDIVADVYDTRLDNQGNSPNPTGAVAPYQISFQIRSNSEEELTDFISNYQFDDYPENDQSEIAFSLGSTNSHFEYIVTNSPFNAPFDRFWNTRLKEGITDDWEITNENYPLTEALINEDASFQDGEYIIYVRARDIDNDNTYNQTNITKNILIDNFQPYIKDVSITHGFTTYERKWQWGANPAQNDEYMLCASEFQFLAIPIDNNSVIEIEIETSEPMAEVYLNVFNIDFTMQQAPSTPEGTIWRKSIDLAQENIELNNFPGKNIWSFTGTDLAENELLSLQTDPDTWYNADQIPHRTGNNSWSSDDIPQGTDEVHVFFVDDCGQSGTFADDIDLTDIDITAGLYNETENLVTLCMDDAVLKFNVKGNAIPNATFAYSPLAATTIVNQGSEETIAKVECTFDFAYQYPEGIYPVVFKIEDGFSCEYRYVNVTFSCDETVCNGNPGNDCLNECEGFNPEYEIVCNEWGYFQINFDNGEGTSINDYMAEFWGENNTDYSFSGDLNYNSFTINFQDGSYDRWRRIHDIESPSTSGTPGDYDYPTLFFQDVGIDYFNDKLLVITDPYGCDFTIPIDEYPCQGVFVHSTNNPADCFFPAKILEEYCKETEEGEKEFYLEVMLTGYPPITVSGDANHVFGTPGGEKQIFIESIGPLPYYYDIWTTDASGCKAHIIGNAGDLDCDFVNGKTVVERDDKVLPDNENLCSADLQLSPNPFRENVRLNYKIENGHPDSQKEQIVIQVQSLNGGQPTTIYKGPADLNREHSLSYDTGTLASGMYIFTLQGECGVNAIAKGIKY